MEHIPRGARGHPDVEDRRRGLADPRHEPGDIQLPRAAVRHQASKRAHPRSTRRCAPRGGAVIEASWFDRGPRRHPQVPAATVGAQSHPREPGCEKARQPDPCSINPGSSYTDGVLQRSLLELCRRRFRRVSAISEWWGECPRRRAGTRRIGAPAGQSGCRSYPPGTVNELTVPLVPADGPPTISPNLYAPRWKESSPRSRWPGRR